MAPSLPPNVHVSSHPCLLAKLSQLRSKSTPAVEVKALVHEIALILGCEALARNLTATAGSTDVSPLGAEYTTTAVAPQNMCLVPILRSGLGMVEAVQTLLPVGIPVHHLGIYREPTTLSPVEYYNNLPNHISSGSSESVPALAIVVDPIIATGGTCVAAIQTLREWGAKHILVLSVLSNTDGIKRCAEEWPEGTEIWTAGVDEEITATGMLKPGVGDIGDRLFLTVGK